MSRQQLSLHGSPDRRTTVDRRAAAGFVTGRHDLRHALGLEDADLQALRVQAQAFYHAGRWAQCIDVAVALIALDALEPWDAVMLSRAYDEVGDPEAAAACAATAEAMLSELAAASRTPTGESSR